MAGKVKVKIGDVFQIPVDETRVGYGQMVMQPEKKVFFVCIFGMTGRRDEQPDPDAIVRSQIVLVANTFDAKLWNGQWPVVGNVPPDTAAIALPNYKEGLPGQAFVENLDRTKRRRATIEEEHILPFRAYVSPMILQDAVQALFGVGGWLSTYDKLKYEHAQRSSSIRF